VSALLLNSFVGSMPRSFPGSIQKNPLLTNLALICSGSFCHPIDVRSARQQGTPGQRGVQPGAMKG
jgi:hypothetical protein